jgi:hypothetical protein
MRSAAYSATRVWIPAQPGVHADGALSGIYRLLRHDGADREHVPPSGGEGLRKPTVISYNGTEIDLGKPFRRLTMIDAVKEYSGVDFNEIHTDEEAKAIAKEKHVEFEEHHKRGDIINLFFDEFCEDQMIQPTFVMDHPIEISPLTKKKPDDPSLLSVLSSTSTAGRCATLTPS